jgi:hypothetical protein
MFDETFLPGMVLADFVHVRPKKFSQVFGLPLKSNGQ